MKANLQDMKIRILELVASGAGAYYSFNLTQNIIPGFVYQTADGKEVNVNELAGLPENARWTDYIAFWGNRLSGEEKTAYFEFFNREALLQRYAAGDDHFSYTYWVETATLRPMLAEQHIFLFEDEDTGDIQGVTYILDRTERERAQVQHRQLASKLKKSLEERNAHQQYLELLTQDFLVVYLVNLRENTSTPIKADPSVVRYDPVKVKLRRCNPYSERIETYSRGFVAEDLRAEFTRVMQADNILRELEHAPRFVYRYRTIPRQEGQQYFEAQALRMQETEESGEVLLGFRCIDDVVTAEQRRQIELEELTEQMRIQLELLQALGRNYHAIFRIDLQNDSYSEISCREDLHCYYDNSDPSAAGTLAKLCEDIISPRYIARMQSFFNLETLPQRLAEQDYVEAECIIRDNSWHRAKFIVQRRDEQGQATHVLYVTQVIDSEKQYEERLIARAEYADYANQAKTDFISQIAHDIRTPLNSIFGFVEIARANSSDPETLRNSLQQIQRAGEFLKELADDVLDVSRMERGIFELTPAPISLGVLMREYEETTQYMNSEKKHRVTIDVHNISHDCIVVDRLRLCQIYNNLFSNAVKYTQNCGEIWFEVYQEESPCEGKVRLITVISDTGVGMSEEFMERMFAKFERETDTRVNKVSGCGLGLSIVKQLVDLMGGSIQVESKQGEGTKFVIELELPWVDTEPTRSEEQVAEPSGGCAGMHLLVAEDNELNREVLTALLDMHGISCDCVENGELCVEKICTSPQGKYDAVLMDMQMPIMNGVEAAEKIRALPFAWAEAIPIIALTANAMQNDVQSCLEAGMDRHMAKPVDIEQLSAALCELVPRGK